MSNQKEPYSESDFAIHCYAKSVNEEVSFHEITMTENGTPILTCNVINCVNDAVCKYRNNNSAGINFLSPKNADKG